MVRSFPLNVVRGRPSLPRGVSGCVRSADCSRCPRHHRAFHRHCCKRHRVPRANNCTWEPRRRPGTGLGCTPCHLRSPRGFHTHSQRGIWRLLRCTRWRESPPAPTRRSSQTAARADVAPATRAAGRCAEMRSLSAGPFGAPNGVVRDVMYGRAHRLRDKFRRRPEGQPGWGCPAPPACPSPTAHRNVPRTSSSEMFGSSSCSCIHDAVDRRLVWIR